MNKGILHIISILILGICMALPATVQAEEEYLPIVFEDYPPYEYVKDGQVTGMNMDIIREAFKRMGITPFFEPRPWKRGLYQLKHGEILALSSGFKTAERQEFAYFPVASLAMETNMAIALKERGMRILDLQGLRGLRVGVVREYVYGEPFDSMSGLDKVETASSHQLLNMLLNRRIDVAICNLAVFRHLGREAGALDKLDFIYEIGSDPLYIMFSKAHGKKAKELADRFGKVVLEMRKDGTVDAIISKY